MTIEELLREAGVKTYSAGEHHHVTHGWLGIDCPYCGPNEARLGIPLDRPVVASCWSCGAHSVYDVLLQLGGPQLARKAKRIEFVDPIPQVKRRGTLKRPNGLQPLTLALCTKHWRYLRERKVNPDNAAGLWRVGAIQLAVKYAWRLYIPITLDGEEVSFTTRDITGKKYGYQNASPDEEAVSAKDVLYGADLARNGIIVCEGPLDAMRIGPGGCATLGLAFTRSQVLQASRFRKKVVCFDAEPRAQQVARRLCDQLEPFGPVTNVVLESGKDPSRASEKEVEQLRRLIR